MPETIQGEGNLSLKRARRTGLWICGVTALGAVLFVGALARESYWALAIPVAVGVLTALSLSFWIGYTIATVRGIPPEAEQYEGALARRIAKGICAASVVLALLFVIGVLRGSYWALALPVAGAVLGVAGMVFWIGWNITQQRSTLDQFQDAHASNGGHPAAPKAAPDAAPKSAAAAPKAAPKAVTKTVTKARPKTRAGVATKISAAAPSPGNGGVMKGKSGRSAAKSPSGKKKANKKSPRKKTAKGAAAPKPGASVDAES